MRQQQQDSRWTGRQGKITQLLGGQQQLCALHNSSWLDSCWHLRSKVDADSTASTSAVFAHKRAVLDVPAMPLFRLSLRLCFAIDVR